MSVESLTTQIPTLIGSWALLVAKTIESYGLNSEEIFTKSGIDLSDLKKNDSRFPAYLMVNVWEETVKQTQDPYIAIRVAEHFKPSAYSALGLTMAASRHIYDALKRCAQYSKVISDGTMAQLEETDTQVAFVLRPRPGFRALTHITSMSATLCCMFHIFRDLAGETFNLEEVHFEQSLESTKPFEEFFNCPVYYHSDCSKLVFKKSEIFSEQPFSHSKLANSLDEWIEEYLSKFQEEKISTKVQKFLLKHLAYGDLDQPKVAKNLAMSTRMLQRKLQEEGTVYTELLDDCRKKLAIKLIHEKIQPLSEVAHILGFSDQSNFTRAFKRWTGSTPNQFRG
jgi:AraC-like DNA-binding protein